MQKNAFGDLRFSGRDPVDVAEELRASWRDAGPLFEDDDRAQGERFEATLANVLAAAGAAQRPARDAGNGRRPRREHDDTAAPVTTAPLTAPSVTAPLVPAEIEAVPVNIAPLTVVPDAAGSAVAGIETADEVSIGTSLPVSVHDAITQPARLPPEMPIGVDVRATPLPPPARAKSDSMAPKLDVMDEGWDLGDEDPTASAPSSSEMAGDGSVEGDGLDQVD